MANELKVTAERITPTEPEIVLRMPYDVAVSLFSMCGKVYGGPSYTYRGHSDLIYSALMDANVHADDSRFSNNLKAASHV